MNFKFFAARRLLVPGVLITLLFSPAAMAEWFKLERDVMGTRITVEVWAADSGKARQCSMAVLKEMHRIDAVMSPFREDSEIALLNREAAKHPVKVGSELFRLIQRANEVARLSAGAFDITFASIGYKYDFRRKIKPAAEEIAQRLAAVDYHLIKMNAANHTLQFAREGVRIDLGGIAKGYAVDNGIKILKKCGIKNGLVTAGGDSRILGDRHGRPWMMGIRHPRQKNGVAVLLPLSDTAISTSGDYERYFIEKGVRYHHIINPQTGRPVATTWSVSVIGPDATTTDALSTAFFVLGAKKALQLAERLKGIDAVIIDAHGQTHYSSGLMPPAARNRAAAH